VRPESYGHTACTTSTGGWVVHIFLPLTRNTPVWRVTPHGAQAGEVSSRASGSDIPCPPLVRAHHGPADGSILRRVPNCGSGRGNDLARRRWVVWAPFDIASLDRSPSASAKPSDAHRARRRNRLQPPASTASRWGAVEGPMSPSVLRDSLVVVVRQKSVSHAAYSATRSILTRFASAALPAKRSSHRW